jgi:pseudouridine-5'-phosphate glycosidase
VIGFQTDVLPAFYCRESDCRVSHRLDNAQDIAQVLRTQWALGLRGGAVIANPIPAAFAMPRSVIDQAINQALAEATEQHVVGKEVTPFLLARVSELTGGNSLAANIELVLNNARLATAIALHLR